MNFLPRLLFAPLLKWNCLAAFFVKQLRSSFLLRSLKFSGARKRSKSCQFHPSWCYASYIDKVWKTFCPQISKYHSVWRLLIRSQFVLTFFLTLWSFSCQKFHFKISVRWLKQGHTKGHKSCQFDTWFYFITSFQIRRRVNLLPLQSALSWLFAPKFKFYLENLGWNNFQFKWNLKI